MPFRDSAHSLLKKKKPYYIMVTFECLTDLYKLFLKGSLKTQYDFKKGYPTCFGGRDTLKSLKSVK